jgi:predicted enzyme related to lactoylglutathione lyase
MKPTTLFLNLTSDQPEQLMSFYRDVVGLEPRPDMGPMALDAGGAVLGFDGHSETSGKTREPQRALIDFFVEDLSTEQQRLLTAGVPCTRKEGTEFWGGVISTFTDPDGNYFQLIEYKPELDQTRAAS